MSDDPIGHAQWNVLHEGMPEHLEHSVFEWIEDVCDVFSEIPAIAHRTIRYSAAGRDSYEAMVRYARASERNALTVVDRVLQPLHDLELQRDDTQLGGDSEARAARRYALQAARFFYEANSAWQVVTQPCWSLQRVVDETATQAFEQVRDSGTDAARLLNQAGHATFRHTPEHSVGYAKAVQPVESVATSKFTPRDRSLGKSISHLKDTTDRWTVADLDDRDQKSADTLLAMLRTMWQNYQRHVMKDGSAPQDATKDETEAVLFLAITIVQWFQRGLVKRKPVDGP